MDYFGLVNKAVEYIEEHLKEKLTQENISDIIFMSPFHFQRIFKGMTGYSLMEYTRKRRLTEAAKEISAGTKPIIEVAFDYNFGSQETFTRSFMNEFGITPGKYRKERRRIPLFEKIRLWGMRYNIKYQGYRMDYTIEELKEMTIGGIIREITLNEEKNYDDVINIVVELNQKAGLINRKKENTHREIGVVFSHKLDLSNPYKNTFDYLRGFEVEKSEENRGNIIYKKIKSVKCAVFQASTDIEKHREIVDYIYGVWLPESGYKLSKQFDFMEIMTIDESGKYDMKFYIPIIVN